MNFKELLIRAKQNDIAAVEELLNMYTPLLVKESIVDGTFDKDLYQELCLRFMNCIEKFEL